jgi:hypothetical protein
MSTDQVSPLRALQVGNGKFTGKPSRKHVKFWHIPATSQDVTWNSNTLKPMFPYFSWENMRKSLKSHGFFFVSSVQSLRWALKFRFVTSLSQRWKGWGRSSEVNQTGGRWRLGTNSNHFHVRWRCRKVDFVKVYVKIWNIYEHLETHIHHVHVAKTTRALNMSY